MEYQNKIKKKKTKIHKYEEKVFHVGTMMI